MDIVYLLAFYLYIGLLMSVFLFLWFIRDKKIFGESVAKSNASHLMPFAAIAWIYMIFSCQYIIYFLTFDKSVFSNYIVVLLLLYLPNFILYIMNKNINLSLKNQRNDIIAIDQTPRFSTEKLFIIAANICGFTLLYYSLVRSYKLSMNSSLVYLAISGLLIFILVFRLLDKVEFREKGIYSNFLAIKWEEIEVCKYTNEDTTFHIQHRAFLPIRRHLEFQIPINNQDEIIALLDTYLSDRNLE